MSSIKLSELTRDTPKNKRIEKVTKIVCEHWNGVTFKKNRIYNVMQGHRPYDSINGTSGSYAWFKYDLVETHISFIAKFRPAYKNDKEED